MKISASIYSNKEKSREQLVRELDAHGIDMFHIDAFDESVFADIARIRTLSKTPIDLHIIHKDPAKFLSQIAENRIEYVSIQHGPDVVIPALPKGGITKWGLAITASDPEQVLDNIDQHFDLVLFMASQPGLSGKPFNADNFQRIIAFKNKFPKMLVQVDGGVNDRIAFILRLLGVNTIVSGNYIMNNEYLGAGMLNLHKTPGISDVESDFKVADFMTRIEFLPVLKKEELTLKTALESIERYRSGFALITDNGKLYGVISNADVRRGFIRHLENNGVADVLGMVNTKPVTIVEDQTLTGMLHLLNDLNFIVLFLPVVDQQGVLKGAVLLNNLTRV